MRARRWSSLLLAGVLCLSLAALGRADPVDEGRGLYQELCEKCHGKDMANPGLAFDLRKFPANDAQRFSNSVLNGKGPAMPAWKEQLTPQDVDALWAYVKSGG